MVIKKHHHLLLSVIIVLGLVMWFWPKGRHNLPVIESGPNFTIQTWQTTNGAKVMFVPAPNIPMLDIHLVFDAGSARDEKLAGLASLTNALMDQGAGAWDTDAIAERIDSIGAVLGNESQRDMATLSLRSLTRDKILKQALETFSEIVSNPRFATTDLERLRKQTLIALQSQAQSPDDIADKKFFQALYGEHPYASPTLGTRESVKQITGKDIRDFYQRYYVARNAVIAIVGAVDRKQAESIAEQVVGKLSAGQAAPALPEVELLKQAITDTHQHPSTQTHILVGQPGMQRLDEDFYSLYVGNHILGGSGFGSRIMQEIREKRGLAYSSYSYFLPLRSKGPFILGLQTRNDQAPEALKVLNETLKSFIKQGPTVDQLEHAKRNITGGFALRVDSNRDIVSYLAMIGFYSLPMDYLDRFNERVEAVTLKQIKDAFQRRVNPDLMVTVQVGRIKK